MDVSKRAREEFEMSLEHYLERLQYQIQELRNENEKLQERIRQVERSIGTGTSKS